METEFIWAEEEKLPRCYIAVGNLKNFRGHRGVETHIFRTGASSAELEAIRHLGLVGAPDPAMPPQALAGMSEEAALACVLEAFTREEAMLLANYLRGRYEQQFASLVVCPMNFPVPLGVGPLDQIPESEKSGFINFALASGYNLPFGARGYYDLNS